MDNPPNKLPPGAVAVLLLLSMVWGANMAAIKIAAQGLSPIFTAGLRSAVAGLFLLGWMKFSGIAVFPKSSLLIHALAVGVLFGSEFACVYVGLKHTFASRGYIILYTQPFFTALGAHYLLKGDPMHRLKGIGLLLAFAGVVILFARDWGEVTMKTLPGDMLMLSAAALWAGTTLYIKRFLAERAVPMQTLFYQLAFSTPVLFLLSMALEESPMQKMSWPIGLALAYQCLIVAFLSYLVWFILIHRFPVSLLAGFTFFTPVFGVIVSGVIILREPLTAGIVIALLLVSLGMVLVNKPRK
jgi:drug/metabolite transporter (DMT)-like permease